MTNVIQSTPLPFDPESLPTELAMLGTRRISEILCDLHARVTLLETLLDLAPVQPCATPTAAPTAPVREIVEELGNGWRVVRTPVLKCHQTAQDGQGRAQPHEPV